MAHEDDRAAPNPGMSTTQKVVVGILAAAGGLAVVVVVLVVFLPHLVVVSTRNLPARGRRTQVEADLRNILTTAQAIYTDTGDYPESIEAMVGARAADGTLKIASLEKHPRDPWGNEYRFELVNGLPRVTCLGSDGAPGGEGEAADVVRPEASP